MHRYLLASLTLLVSTVSVRAGDLNPPPGPIGPTFRTLQEIYDQAELAANAAVSGETRIPVSIETTPGDADSVFKITQPGSYFLAGPVIGEAGKHGIEIASSKVTLDLMGFELRGVATGLDGIFVSPIPSEDIVIRNGIILDWGGDGVHVISSNGAKQHVAFDLIVEGNGGNGVQLDRMAHVSRCTVRNNGGDGIVVNDDSVVFDCVSNENDGDGIQATSGGLIRDCAVSNNTGDGIRAAGRCAIVGNQCDANGAFAGDGAGIHVSGNSCRVEDNHVTGNDRGIDVDAGNNVIVRNTAGVNTINYDVVANGNLLGPIVTSANISTNNNPHSNYSL